MDTPRKIFAFVLNWLEILLPAHKFLKFAERTCAVTAVVYFCLRVRAEGSVTAAFRSLIKPLTNSKTSGKISKLSLLSQKAPANDKQKSRKEGHSSISDDTVFDEQDGPIDSSTAFVSKHAHTVGLTYVFHL